jgi:hypothetical protein
MIRGRFYIIIFSQFILLTACTVYKLGDEKFYSGADAIQRQLTIQSMALSGINPTDDPIHGYALLIYPSDNEIIRNHIKYSGMRSGISPSTIENEPKEGTNFLTTLSNNNFQFVINAIRKRNIFDTVMGEPHNGQPASYLNDNFDYIIFFDVDGWFIKGKKHPMPLLIEIDRKVSLNSQMPVFLELLSEKAYIIKGSN